MASDERPSRAALDWLNALSATEARRVLQRCWGAAGASDAVLAALRDKNSAYRARFGYSFIVCATGKTAGEMLALLEGRLNHAAEFELGIAAAEHAKITRLRLEKLTP